MMRKTPSRATTIARGGTRGAFVRGAFGRSMTMTRASSEAVSNESRGADAVRYDDGDIPREVGRASKEELGKWLESRRLPTQKMALEVNLAEGRGAGGDGGDRAG